MTTILFGATGALGRSVNAQPIGARTLHNARKFMFLDLHGLCSELKGADAVINCAAMTGLDKCFHEVKSASIINTEWPIKLATACRALRIPFLHFSTEAVFAGDKIGKIYAESDIPDPTTFYGVSKLNGEPAPPCTVARLPLLYGPTNGKQVIACLLRRVLRGEDVTIADDIYTTPLYTPHAAEWACDWLHLQHVPHDQRHLVHLSSDGHISLFDFMSLITRQIDSQHARGRVIAGNAEMFQSAELKPQHLGLRSQYVLARSLEAGVMKYAEWINKNRGEFLGTELPQSASI